MVFRFLTIAWNSSAWPGGLVNELDEVSAREVYGSDLTPAEYASYWRMLLFPGYGVYHIT